jgi:hypothetical protein
MSRARRSAAKLLTKDEARRRISNERRMNQLRQSRFCHEHFLIQIKELISEQSVHVMLRASSEGPSFATEEFMGKLVLGAAALALSAGAASAQTVYPGYDGYTATAPLYDYAGPASSAPVPTTPLRYGPLIYAPQLFAPTPAFPTPPAAPGYYTAQSVVVSQPVYDYAPGYWAR